MSKYTKEQLEVMSDLEVNKVLEKLTGMYCEDVNGKYTKSMDYCNEPSAIMPLALAHNVGIMPYDVSEEHDEYSEYKDVWFAQHGVFDHETNFDSKNPYRAIACCLILILGA